MTALFLGPHLLYCLSTPFHDHSTSWPLFMPSLHISFYLLRFSILLTQSHGKGPYSALFPQKVYTWSFLCCKFFTGISNIHPASFLGFLLWPHVAILHLQEYFRLLRLKILIIFFQITTMFCCCFCAWHLFSPSRF